MLETLRYNFDENPFSAYAGHLLKIQDVLVSSPTHRATYYFTTWTAGDTLKRYPSVVSNAKNDEQEVLNYSEIRNEDRMSYLCVIGMLVKIVNIL